MVAGDELGLGFGQIERSAVGLGVGGEQIDDEGDGLEATEDIPGEHAVGGLGADDIAQAKRAGAKDDADQRKAEGEFVGDHLRGGAQAAEQGELVIRAPARERDAVDADRRDAKDDQKADIDVRDIEHVDAGDAVRRAEGNDRDGDEGADERDHRGGDEEGLLSGDGQEVFLEEELDAIGERLQQTERTDAARSPAVLHAAEDLTLEQHGVGDGGERQHEDDEDLQDAEQEEGEEGAEMGHSVSSEGSCVVKWRL